MHSFKDADYRILFDYSADAMLIIDGSEFVDCNEATLILLGYKTREHLLGSHPSKLSPEFQPDGCSSFEKAEAMINIAFKHGSHRFEWIHKRVNGQCFPVEVLLTAIPFEDRKVLHTVLRDITERKQAEQASRESEERFSKAFGASPTAMVIVSVEGYEIVNANDEWLSLLGFSRDDVIGKTSSEIGVWVDIGRRSELIERLERDGSVRDFEASFLTKLGEERLVLLAGEIIEISGNPHVLLVLHDVTERKRSELALKESERRFDLALRSTEDGLWDWTVGAGEMFLSPRWKQMLGYTDEEIRPGDDPFPNFIHPDDKEQVLGDIEDFFKSSNDRYQQEFRLRHKDGHYLIVQSTAFAERDNDGRVTRFTGRHTDVTSIRETEHQLQQAQKMEAVGQLTGGIAHDFNNLLQVIETNLEMAKETLQGDSGAKRFLDGAQRAGRRGANLTHQLLAFSRKQTLLPDVVDAGSLVEGMTSLLRRTLGEDISVETSIPDSRAIIFVDENGLTNALLNLAINARAAMPKGGILTVAVGKRKLDMDVPVENEILSAGDYVEIAVTDTGFGISEENLGQVFVPFFTTKGVGEGSGLGLSMVYGFARQSGGNVTIESERDKGTTVRIVLPAATGELVSRSDAQSKLEDVKHEIKVLLVEDDADVRASTVVLLKSLGCEVFEAESAAPVLDILRQEDGIEFLISDVVLPGGKNGIELAQEAVRLHPALKVILVSGHSEGTLEKAGLKEVGFRLLGKPYTTEALSEALGSVMAQ